MGDAQITIAADDTLCFGCGGPLGIERIGIIGVPGVWHAHCLPHPSTVRLLSIARAEARREALEEAVKIFDKQRPEWVEKKQGEYWDGYRDAIEDAIDEIRGVSTIARTRRAAALSELAAQDAELIDEPDPDLIRDDAHERRRLMKEYPDEE